MKFHTTHLGDFGRRLPRDREGYCYTTISGWLHSDQGGELNGWTAEQRREWAREMAAQARAALRDSEMALGDWQRAENR